MIESNQSYTEHLYLDRGNDNYIYVKNCQNLKQHQVDGLRFLYRQFKKGKLGAVLNFPPGSGKSLIVALFLNAVTSVLKERVLILCTDNDEIENWKELFLAWTEYNLDEIAIESSNPRIKKKIFLKNVDDLSSYLRCNWGVVVVKDDMCKSLQKITLEADLKIWITSTDIKKDDALLCFIHKWIFPKSKINMNDILMNEGADDKMLQSIILDSFLEDFVIRENKIKAISYTKNTKILQDYKDSKKTKTRKNKDASGTKIKRSKIINDDECISTITPTDIQTDNFNISNDPTSNASIEDNESADIKRKAEIGLHGDIFVHASQEKNNQTNPSETNQTVIKVEGTSQSLEFREAIADIIDNENKPETCFEDSTESFNFEEKKSDAFENNSESILEAQNSDNLANTIAFTDNINSCCNMFSEDNLCNDNKSPNKSTDIQMDLNDSIATKKSEKCLKGLEHKISELEERTIKKFKGSLLDSIF